MYSTDIKEAAKTIKESNHTIVFSGAGISVESGIPAFRGVDGLWSRIDNDFIDLDYFSENPFESWKKIKEIFYEFMASAKPNPAHRALAKLEKEGFIKSIITQNIDNLHQDAGSKEVIEFHGTKNSLSCVSCLFKLPAKDVDMGILPIKCPKCGGLMKPDFVFFREMIDPNVSKKAFEEARKADVVIVIGTTGDVMPACQIPVSAKFPNEGDGAKIIEINITETVFSSTITDYFLIGKASEVLNTLVDEILK